MIVMTVLQQVLYRPDCSLEELKHDIGEFLEQYPTTAYLAYFDTANDNFVCEMEPEQELIFVLKHPKYQRYVQTQC